jgi:hypothetical protein
VAIFHNYGRRLLAGLDIVPTAARLEFLHAWQRCEGGAARNNPWNTTERVPGSTLLPGNPAGVQEYPDDVAGLAATLLTIRLRPYLPMVAALRTDGLTAQQIARRSLTALDVWGTGGARVLAALGS